MAHAHRRHRPGLAAGLLDPVELDVPDVAEHRAAVEDVDQAAADATDRRDFQFSRPYRLFECLDAKRTGSCHRGVGILHIQPDGIDRRAVDKE